MAPLEPVLYLVTLVAVMSCFTSVLLCLGVSF